jgi:hypothetical protein
MDDPNIDDEDEQQAQAQAQDEQQQQPQPQPQQAVVLLKKMILVLEQKETFPFRTRNKTDELVENFLQELGDDVHDMICDNHIDADNYCGLDSKRDTEEEVEAILRVFPEVLSRRKGIVVDIFVVDDDDDADDVDIREFFYPIQLIGSKRGEGLKMSNVEAVVFVPLLARLAIEFGCFDEVFRGGLLCKDDCRRNVLENLMVIDNMRGNRQYHENIHDKHLQVLIQLRRMSLLKKEDIRELLHHLCSQACFSEKRFRILVKWDPSSLIPSSTDQYDGWLPPLHNAARIVATNFSIRGFQLVFEAGIKFFPKRKGINLLFHKTILNYDTPFQRACKTFGREKVMKIIEDTLVRYSDTPINIADALLSAATDKNVILDGVYFLLRREPDVLQKLLSFSPSSSSMAVTDCNTNINNNNSINDNNDVITTNNLANEKDRKRKRD